MADSRSAAVVAQVAALCAEIGPGAVLPGERELALRHHVSRTTVRRAIEELIARRVVERRHGACGWPTANR